MIPVIPETKDTTTRINRWVHVIINRKYLLRFQIDHRNIELITLSYV